jgi:dolichol kinase
MNAPVFVDKSMEGTVTMFPSSMIHCVYPFRTSDGERISIAGNIYPKRD